MPPPNGASASSDNKTSAIPTVTGDENAGAVSFVPLPKEESGPEEVSSKTNGDRMGMRPEAKKVAPLANLPTGKPPPPTPTPRPQYTPPKPAPTQPTPPTLHPVPPRPPATPPLVPPRFSNPTPVPPRPPKPIFSEKSGEGRASPPPPKEFPKTELPKESPAGKPKTSGEILVERPPLSEPVRPPAQKIPEFIPTPPLPPPPPEAESPKIKAIRTYQSDVAENVKGQKTSLVRMVIAESERKKKLAEIESPTSKLNLFLIAASVILLLGGTLTAIYVFNKSREAKIAVPTGVAPALIFAEKDKHLSVTGLKTERLAAAVGEEVATANNKLDTIENISFSETVSGTETPLTTERFFFFLDSRMPPALIRSLDKNFMLGFHTFNGNQPFLILRTTFYENTFAGMLGWEEYMTRDLFPLFNIREDPSSGVFGRPFEDRTVKNRDARVLKDDSGNVILFYTFKDKQTLIITTSPDTLEEVTRRLNSAKPLESR